MIFPVFCEYKYALSFKSNKSRRQIGEENGKKKKKQFAASILCRSMDYCSGNMDYNQEEQNATPHFVMLQYWLCMQIKKKRLQKFS